MGLGAMKNTRTFDGGFMLLAKKYRRSGRILVLTVIAITCTAVLASAANGDKGKIVFVSDRTGSWQVYTMNPDGTDLFQVTNLEPTDDDGIFPSLSPNGQWIAFDYNAGEGPDLFVVNVNGTGLRQITNDQGSFLPRWSPDGTRIIYSAFAGLRSAVIATIPADGTGSRKVLTSDVWESVGGFYTPNGKQIIFGSQMGGLVSAAWIMNADGSHQRRLTPAAVKAQPWGVSPDSKHILAYANQDTPPALESSIFVINRDGGQRKTLASTSVFHHDGYPSYSPDGSRISFISDRFSTDITEFTYGTFDIVTTDADGLNLTVAEPAVGYCPFDGNCVTPLWSASPQE
jgi:Tol biopolymer transport system component